MEAVKEKTAQFEAPNVVILPFEHQEEFYVEELQHVPSKPVYRFIKRALDILFALLALVVTIIPIGIIALIIKCSSPGSVFYLQERLGLNGKPFRIIKFRTMCMDAERNGAQWSEGDEDPRITPIGSKLRKYRLDELPQFFNVLGGSMSFVGPRPERACFYDAFEEYVHGFSQRLLVKPGVTGLSQVNGGYLLRPEEKIIHDIQYIKSRSLWMDISVLFKTVYVVLFHKDAK